MENVQGKNVLQKKLREQLKSYGYEDIQTPMFEFFDIFNTEIGTVSSKDMYKFFDREGNTLVLRPDITPSIARVVAKCFERNRSPMRFSYMGNTFINNSSLQGLMKETTQIGAELVGDDSTDADGELVALAIDMLLKSGLTQFQLDIGHVGFFNGIVEESGMDSALESELRALIESKNFLGGGTCGQPAHEARIENSIFKTSGNVWDKGRAGNGKGAYVQSKGAWRHQSPGKSV